LFSPDDIVNEADLRAAMGKLAGVEPGAASPIVKRFKR
jgi:hypothetical protein